MFQLTTKPWKHMRAEQVGLAVTLLYLGRGGGLLGSNLSWDIGYPDRLLIVFHIPLRQMPGYYFEQAMTASFLIL
jgi:hypothetical protein